MRKPFFLSVFLIVLLASAFLVVHVKPQTQITYLKTFEKDGTSLKIPEFTFQDSMVTSQDTKEFYQFNITLSKIPLTNVFNIPIETQGLNFYYQPPLNQELNVKNYDFVNETHAINNSIVVNYRPLNVVGSYAVYRSDGKTGNQYLNGKLYHIYRPLLIDAKGAVSWTALTVSKTGISIICDSEFLVKAVYPVVLDPIFGYDTIGGTEADHMDGHCMVFNFTLTENAADVIEVSSYIFGKFGATNLVKAVLYESDWDLVTNSSDQAITAAETWNNFTISTGGLASGNYYLGMAPAESVTIRYHYDAGSANQRALDTMTDYNLNDPYTPEGWGYAAEKGSIYATYTVSGTEMSEFGSAVLAFSSGSFLSWLFSRDSGQTVAFQSGNQREVVFSVMGAAVTAFTSFGHAIFSFLITEYIFSGAAAIAFLVESGITGLALGEITSEMLIALIIMFFIIAIALAVSALGISLKKK